MIATQPCTQHLRKYTAREGVGGVGQWRRFILRKYSDHYLKPGHKHLPFFLNAHKHAERCFYNVQIINTYLEPHVKGIRFEIMFWHIFRKHMRLAAPSKIMLLLCSLVAPSNWKLKNRQPKPISGGWKTAFKKQGNSLSTLFKPTFLDLRCGWCVSIRFSSASSLLVLKHRTLRHKHTHTFSRHLGCYRGIVVESWTYPSMKASSIRPLRSRSLQSPWIYCQLPLPSLHRPRPCAVLSEHKLLSACLTVGAVYIIYWAVWCQISHEFQLLRCWCELSSTIQCPELHQMTNGSNYLIASQRISISSYRKWPVFQGFARGSTFKLMRNEKSKVS